MKCTGAGHDVRVLAKVTNALRIRAVSRSRSNTRPVVTASHHVAAVPCRTSAAGVRSRPKQ